MKAFLAIFLTLILVAAQSGAAATSPAPGKTRCCCAGDCQEGCGCIGKSDDAPAPQPATPAPTSPETGLGPLLLATALQISLPAASHCSAPAASSSAFQSPQVPIFRRNCSILL